MSSQPGFWIMKFNLVKVWERFRVYKLVERECERIEAEVREQVEQEMKARKDSKKKKAVASFDDVKGWERRIRTIKREIRDEFDMDLDKKVPKKEPKRVTQKEVAKAKPQPAALGRVTQVMPSARKAFMESMERKGVVVIGKQGGNSIASKFLSYIWFPG